MNLGKYYSLNLLEHGSQVFGGLLIATEENRERRLVGQVDQLQLVAKIIGQHQEKFDGTGYPKSLGKDEIILEARIIMVTDARDAMRADRPYRDALPREVAIEGLKDNSGTQFDPEIVETFLDIIDEDKSAQ